MSVTGRKQHRVSISAIQEGNNGVKNEAVEVIIVKRKTIDVIRVKRGTVEVMRVKRGW